jgi:glycosyltransferase involved in cell wall biosynthesis
MPPDDNPLGTDCGRPSRRDVAQALMRRAVQQPLVSVLVNNHNYGHFLAQAVTSALVQEKVAAEVIVVDDGSNDQSRAILEDYRGRATIVLQDNRGQAAAINAGVRASRGDILCFLDADDWWAPGKLSSIVGAFGSDPRLLLAYHRLQPVLVDGKPTLKPVPRTLCSGDLSRRLKKAAGWWPFPMTSAIAVRRSAWQLVGDIPEHFRISADAWLAGIYPLVGRVAALPDSLGFYRIHANNWYRPVDDAPMLRKRMAHWQTTVDATNQFLAERGLPERLSLADHYPYHVALARLDGAGMRTRLGLALEGLRFAGEPNPLRRVRDAVRTAFDLPSVERRVGLSEAAK